MPRQTTHQKTKKLPKNALFYWLPKLKVFCVQKALHTNPPQLNMQHSPQLVDDTKRMLDAHTTSAVRKLSEVYDFPLEQALARLSLAPDVAPPPPKRSRPAVSFPLPFCGVVAPELCHGIRFNKGLFTQCTNVPKPAGPQAKCATCRAEGKRSVCCGDILQRSGLGWTDRRGRKPVPYHVVLAKSYPGVTRAQAEAAAAEQGLTILASEFEPAAPSKRGRPPKVKRVVSASQGDDMLDALVSSARQMTLTEPETQEAKCQRLFGSDSDDEEAAYDAETETDEPLTAVAASTAFIDGIEYIYDKATDTAYDLATQNKIGVRHSDGSGWAYVTDWAHDSMLADGRIS